MFITANKYFVAFFIVFSEHSSNKLIKHVVHKNVVGGSSIIWVFPHVIANSVKTCQRPNHWATRSEAISWPGNSGVPPTIVLLEVFKLKFRCTKKIIS